MAVSEELFKKGMRRLGGAVTIVTASDGASWAGLTATAVTSLSAEPPRILSCINRQGQTFEILSKGRSLCINVLATKHKDLAMRFAGMDGVQETERFDEERWAVSVTGAPYLKDAMVSFHCDVDSILDAGSHAIVIGAIKDIHCAPDANSAMEAEDDGLFYMDGKWAKLISFDGV